jgi:hypothetical protein
MMANDFLVSAFFLITTISGWAIMTQYTCILMALPLYPQKYRNGKFCFICLKKLCKVLHKLFKWVKQHLKVKPFWGHSENAVKTRVWIAVSIYALADTAGFFLPCD